MFEGKTVFLLSFGAFLPLTEEDRTENGAVNRAGVGGDMLQVIFELGPAA